jgi:hypothetical protein
MCELNCRCVSQQYKLYAGMGLPVPMQNNLRYYCVWRFDEKETRKLITAGVIPKHSTSGETQSLQAFTRGVEGETHYFCFVDKTMERIFSNFSAMVSARCPQHKFGLQPVAEMRLSMRAKYRELLALYKLRPEDLGGRDISEFVPREISGVANLDDVVAALPCR